MIHPRRVDGEPIRVNTMLDGRVFVDVQPEMQHGSTGFPRMDFVSRGGPEHSRHFCRFEDYGLADGLLRCKKCGLLKEIE